MVVLLVLPLVWPLLLCGHVEGQTTNDILKDAACNTQKPIFIFLNYIKQLFAVCFTFVKAFQDKNMLYLINFHPLTFGIWYLPFPSSVFLHTISDRWSGPLTCDPWDCNCTFNQQSGCCCGAKDLYQLEDDTSQRLKYLWQDITALDSRVQTLTGKHTYTDRWETEQYVRQQARTTTQKPRIICGHWTL